MEELRALCAAHKANNGWVQLGFNRPHAPLVRRVIESMDSEKHLLMNCVMESYPQPPNDWYHWSKEHGRVILNMCHFVDLCHHLGGRSLPVTIAGSRSNKGRYYEDVSITVTYENGSVAQILYSCEGNRIPGGQEWLQVFHQGRTFTVEDMRRLTVYDNGRSSVIRCRTRDKGHASLMELLAANLRDNKPSSYTLYDLAVTSYTLLKADEAVREQKTIYIDAGELKSLYS